MGLSWDNTCVLITREVNSDFVQLLFQMEFVQSEQAGGRSVPSKAFRKSINKILEHGPCTLPFIFLGGDGNAALSVHTHILISEATSGSLTRQPGCWDPCRRQPIYLLCPAWDFWA